MALRQQRLGGSSFRGSAAASGSIVAQFRICMDTRATATAALFDGLRIELVQPVGAHKEPTPCNSAQIP